MNRRFSNKTKKLSQNSVYSRRSMSFRRPKSIVTNRECCQTSDRVQKFSILKVRETTPKQLRLSHKKRQLNASRHNKATTWQRPTIPKGDAKQSRFELQVKRFSKKDLFTTNKSCWYTANLFMCNNKMRLIAKFYKTELHTFVLAIIAAVIIPIIASLLFLVTLAREDERDLNIPWEAKSVWLCYLYQ